MSPNVSANNLGQMLISLGADLSVVDQFLPTQIHEMAERIGYANTFQVVAKLGGTTWKIPMRKSTRAVSKIAKAKLAGALDSAELEALLCDHYEGHALYVPRCESSLRAVRDMVIHKTAEDGLRSSRSMVGLVKELATQFSLSDRRIWKILKEPSPALLAGSIAQPQKAIQHG